ncbi:hypothetical protein EVAR_92050_1 [Eumeta japonica]|uniref:Uncharacterized protein n=1 Tax=Eumeta variegata TaxID=151549 RepID=A0A4C1SY70_EUMVA|nr:hypothetical protein EVAR_92050_1 [Eumeta japonica]
MGVSSFNSDNYPEAFYKKELIKVNKPIHEIESFSDLPVHVQILADTIPPAHRTAPRAADRSGEAQTLNYIKILTSARGRGPRPAAIGRLFYFTADAITERDASGVPMPRPAATKSRIF